MTGRYRVLGGVFLFAVLSCATSPLFAQEVDFSQAVDVQLFHPAKDAYGMFTVDSGDINAHLRANGGLYFNWAYKPLSVVYTGDRVSAGEIIQNRIDATLVAAFGLLDYLELGLAMPMVLFQNGGTTEQVLVGAFGDPNASLTSTTIGDAHVMLKGRFLNIDEGKLSMAMAVDVGIPSGDENAFAGEAGVTASPYLALSTTTKLLHAAVNIGYRYRNEKTRVMTLDAGDELFYRAGLGMFFGPFNAYYEIAAEIYGHTGVSNPFGLKAASGAEAQNPMEALVGLKHIRVYPFGEINFGGGVGMGVLPGYGSPQVRLFAKAGYYMGEMVADEDQDGVPDEHDKCPDRLEDIDDFQDTDGCPDPDNDKDGVLDEDDSCPMEPEDMDGYEDRDGCPEPDNDGDGITDGADTCPTDAEDFDGFKDEDGCPEPDNDEDGVFDEADDCPQEKEDLDGFQDEDGCPDPDNDNDGLEDWGDTCPNKAEDKDGFEDDDGCPDPDNDGDGFLDSEDKCPNKAEVINNFKDDDGCPDRGKQLVKVTKDKITIKQKVQFRTGRARIRRRSYKLLDQIATVMRTHKEILKLQIEGHTDSRGSRRRNMRLSKQRAEAVRQYLIKKGIDPDRMTSVGFGPKKPIASNRTRRGRETNRRVEFTILEQKPVIEMIEVPGEDLGSQKKGGKKPAKEQESIDIGDIQL